MDGLTYENSILCGFLLQIKYPVRFKSVSSFWIKQIYDYKEAFEKKIRSLGERCVFSLYGNDASNVL